jgi:hypothetical protein
LGELQTAIGLGTPPPAGWSLLQHAIGYLWPNGHQDLLRSAAAAWERAAGQLSALVPEVGQAARQVLLQRAPESDGAFTVVDAMTAHLTDLATSYRTLGAACTGYAGHLDQAHHAIISEVESFVEWTAGIEVAGGFFAVCTFGLSEAAAQAGEAAEISRAAAAIKSVIETLRALVTAARSAVDAVTARIVVLADRVSAVLARRIEAAALKQADEIGILRPGAPLPSQTVPRTAATTPEGLAVDKLDTAASLPELTVSRRQIEEKFAAHAKAFGVDSPRGRVGFQGFEAKIRTFVADPETERKIGTYLRQPAVLNYNTRSGLVVVQRPNGEFWSGWVMSQKQLRYVVERGVLGGH